MSRYDDEGQPCLAVCKNCTLYMSLVKVPVLNDNLSDLIEGLLD
jgi:hypothetical protein